MDQSVPADDAEFLPLAFWAALTALALAPLLVVGVLAGVVMAAAPGQPDRLHHEPSAHEPWPDGQGEPPATGFAVAPEPVPFPSVIAPIEPPAVPDGSEHAPIPLRDPGTVGEWHVTIDAGVEATSSLVAAGAPPPAHGRYALLFLTGMFQGDGQGDPASALVAGVRDAGGAEWLSVDCPAVPENALADGGPVLAGQWFTAEVCIDLPPGPDDGALLFLQSPAAESSRMYYR